MSDKTSQVEKKLLNIKLVEIFPSSLLSTRKNQLIDGEAKESPLIMIPSLSSAGNILSIMIFS
ncbi:MAG: hypothetical protein M3264_01565 [Thermoproteota archaeon]|nr:hypothetical protein [Thermoproteota archaeon]